MSSQCTFKKANGEQCKRKSSDPSGLCYVHQKGCKPARETSDQGGKSLFFASEEKPGGANFTMIPNAAFEILLPVEGLPTYGVYTCLCKHANKECEAWPSFFTIASETAQSEITAKRAIKTLCRRRVIEKTTKRKRVYNGVQAYYVNVYRLLHVSEWRITKQDADKAQEQREQRMIESRGIREIPQEQGYPTGNTRGILQVTPEVSVGYNEQYPGTKPINNTEGENDDDDGVFSSFDEECSLLGEEEILDDTSICRDDVELDHNNVSAAMAQLGVKLNNGLRQAVSECAPAYILSLCDQISSMKNVRNPGGLFAKMLGERQPVIVEREELIGLNCYDPYAATFKVTTTHWDGQIETKTVKRDTRPERKSSDPWGGKRGFDE